MTSGLACIGLAVGNETELDRLVTAAHRAARDRPVRRRVCRTLARHQRRDADARLAFRGTPRPDPGLRRNQRGLFSDCHLIDDSVASAAVVDADGHQLTAMPFEAGQYRQLQALGQPVSGPARITALGVAVAIHQDADTFVASPDSLLDPAADPAQEPPPHCRERGWPRVAV